MRVTTRTSTSATVTLAPSNCSAFPVITTDRALILPLLLQATQTVHPETYFWWQKLVTNADVFRFDKYHYAMVPARRHGIMLCGVFARAEVRCQLRLLNQGHDSFAYHCLLVVTIWVHLSSNTRICRRCVSFLCCMFYPNKKQKYFFCVLCISIK